MTWLDYFVIKYLPNTNNTTAVSSNPKMNTATIAITMPIVALLLSLSVGSLVAVLLMDTMLSLDSVVVAIVLITSAELVDGTISVVITVDRKAT